MFTKRSITLTSIYTSIAFIIAISCADGNAIKEKNATSNPYVGTWRLFKTTGNMVGSERTGEDLPFYEEYLIDPDGTFTKIRIDHGITKRAEGSYTFSEENNEATLTYSSPENMIVNCTQDNTEHLIFSSKKTCHNSAMACDQPGLFYEKVTN
ncbi:hypothetical protein GCM10009117_13380 [Gangjinia marincola]|uniref:Lipocalin-like domain-containing protein n=1 Tax=Gangjinia marincola TaxID=578463 RepID=A0ABN1MG86_9FLAO